MMDLVNKIPLFNLKVGDQMLNCICTLETLQAIWISRQMVGALQYLDKQKGIISMRPE